MRTPTLTNYTWLDSPTKVVLCLYNLKASFPGDGSHSLSLIRLNLSKIVMQYVIKTKTVLPTLKHNFSKCSKALTL